MSSKFSSGTINFVLCEQYMSGNYYLPDIEICGSMEPGVVEVDWLGRRIKSIETVSEEIVKKHKFIKDVFFSIKEEHSMDHINDEDIEKIIEKVIDLEHEY